MKKGDLTSFVYVELNPEAKQGLVVLHGTGGDERDLLPLIAGIEGRYRVMSLRGRVREYGMLRFFERLEPGAKVKESVERETAALAGFVKAWREDRRLEERLVWLGYSNGANMILAMTMLHPELVDRAVLLHGMMVIKGGDVDLDGKEFLVTSGEKDEWITKAESKKMVEYLRRHRARVEVVAHQGGHEIRGEEVEALSRFL